MKAPWGTKWQDAGVVLEFSPSASKVFWVENPLIEAYDIGQLHVWGAELLRK